MTVGQARRRASNQKEKVMGLLGKIFSSKPDFPAIAPHSTAAMRLATVEKELHELAETVNDPLEVVPAEHTAYVFLGKPPKKFGLAWIHDGKISGLNTLVEEHGLTPPEVGKVVDQLREAYERSKDVDRYTATVKDVDVVVTPSTEFEKEVHEIIDRILRH
jgi:hypothetical protein